jgi:hypothetical protein
MEGEGLMVCSDDFSVAQLGAVFITWVAWYILGLRHGKQIEREHAAAARKVRD